MPAGRDGPMAWWSPDPRGVLPLDGLRVSRSLRRSLRRYEVRVDTAFAEVVAGCADPARPGGWITADIASAYLRLHELGWAHSVEAWDEDGLAGGLYGVAIGGLFAGESMFSRRTDASKVALVGAGRDPPGRRRRGRLLDVQWATAHLDEPRRRGGARARYLARLSARARARPARSRGPEARRLQRSCFEPPPWPLPVALRVRRRLRRRRRRPLPRPPQRLSSSTTSSSAVSSSSPPLAFLPRVAVGDLSHAGPVLRAGRALVRGLPTTAAPWFSAVGRLRSGAVVGAVAVGRRHRRSSPSSVVPSSVASSVSVAGSLAVLAPVGRVVVGALVGRVVAPRRWGRLRRLHRRRRSCPPDTSGQVTLGVAEARVLAFECGGDTDEAEGGRDGDQGDDESS